MKKILNSCGYAIVFVFLLVFLASPLLSSAQLSPEYQDDPDEPWDDAGEDWQQEPRQDYVTRDDYEDGATGETGDDYKEVATGESGVPGLQNPLGDVESFPDLLEKILRGVVMPIGAVVATLAIIYSGFLFVTAQGNTEKLETARKAFFWSVVGALVLLGALAISAGIEATLQQITGD